MNINKQPSFFDLKNALYGKENYRIGFIFLIGYLLTFFSKMKSNNVPRETSLGVLIILSVVCSLFY